MSFINEPSFFNLDWLNLEKSDSPLFSNLIELIEEFASSINTQKQQEPITQNVAEINVDDRLIVKNLESASSITENGFFPITHSVTNFNSLKEFFSSFSSFQLVSKSAPVLSGDPLVLVKSQSHLIPAIAPLSLPQSANLVELPTAQETASIAAPNSFSTEESLLKSLPFNATLSIYTFGEIDAETADIPIIPQSNISGSLIKLNQFRTDTRFTGIDGRGFAAVILDTGIDLNHSFFGPDSNGDGIADRIVYQYDFADGDGDASDKNGHGSNVSSIVASSDSTYTGVAPGANIIHLKVFKDSGSGSFWYVEQALQWVVANASTYNIASVNMSLGDNSNYNIPVQFYGITDEMAALANLNVAVVSASGNSFYEFNSVQGVTYPSADPNSFSVGAVYDSSSGGWSYSGGAKASSSKADVIAPFSQRHATMTTIFAPGAPITGANWNGKTVTMHGTSQAAPQIAGVSVLAQQLATQELGRRLSVTELKDLLVSTGKTIIDGDDENDNVTNTGLSFKRVDMLALGEAIINLGRPQLSINSATPTQNEGNSRTVAYGFTVSLNKASNQVITVNYSTNDGSATLANNDYIDNDGVLTFNPGETTKTITVLVNGDTIAELDETFSVRLNSASNASINAQSNQVTGTIVNDDLLLLNVGVNGLTKTFSIESYGGSVQSQDVNPLVTIASSGNEIDIQGNSWKKLGLNYNLTANTILEFEFCSTAQGKVQGIGFDTDNELSAERLFQLYGSQELGIQNFDNYVSSAGNWKFYQISAGNFFTGQMNFLTFANDSDATNPTASSQFRNINLYENNGTRLAVAVSGTTKTYLTSSYGGSSQDVNSKMTINGQELQIQGNGWKKLALNYNITANTILEFEFRSTAQGEVQGIGFDTDNELSAERLFQLYGTQDWGIKNFDNYASSAGNWKSYQISAGKFFTGQMNFLTFANDHDTNKPTASSQFRAIRLYESTALAKNIAPATNLTALGDKDTLTGMNGTNSLIAEQIKDSLSEGNYGEQIVCDLSQDGNDSIAQAFPNLVGEDIVPLSANTSNPFNSDSFSDDKSLLPLSADLC